MVKKPSEVGGGSPISSLSFSSDFMENDDFNPRAFEQSTINSHPSKNSNNENGEDGFADFKSAFVNHHQGQHSNNICDIITTSSDYQLSLPPPPPPASATSINKLTSKSPIVSLIENSTTSTNDVLFDSVLNDLHSVDLNQNVPNCSFGKCSYFFL